MAAVWGSSILELMQQTPVQTLEVRAPESGGAVTITLAVTAEASQGVFTALSEQLDRRRRAPIEDAEDALALRHHVELMERFEALAAAEASGIVCLTANELCSCLLELIDYAERVDGEHYQPPDVRERLQLIDQVAPVLWDANAAAAAAVAAFDEESLARPSR